MGGLNWKFNKLSKNSFKKILISKITKFSELKGKHKIIMKKSDIIVKNFLLIEMYVYKGCFYRRMLIRRFTVGHRFGEFTFTRKPFKFIPKIKKKKN